MAGPLIQAVKIMRMNSSLGFFLTNAIFAPIWPSVSSRVARCHSVPVAPRTAATSLIYAVDNDGDILDLYATLLEASGFSVNGFRDRADALAALEETTTRPNLIIMDYLGHSMSAERFILRALALHPTLRILMASGLSRNDLRFSNIRPNRFIRKPFTTAEFISEVKASLWMR